MKKLTAILICLVLLLTLAACGEKEETPQPSASAEAAEAPAATQEPAPEATPAPAAEPSADPAPTPEAEPAEAPREENADREYTMMDYYYTSMTSSDFVTPGDYCDELREINLPYLDMPTQDAVDFNAEMEKLAAAGESITYAASQNDSFVSILLSNGSCYNFSLTDGLLMTSEEVLAACETEAETIRDAYVAQCTAYYEMCRTYYSTDMTTEQMVDEAMKLYDSGFSAGANGIYCPMDGNILISTHRRDVSTGEALADFIFLYSPSAAATAAYNAPKEAAAMVIFEPEEELSPVASYTVKASGTAAAFMAMRDGLTLELKGSGKAVYSDAVDLEKWDAVTAVLPVDGSVRAVFSSDDFSCEYSVTKAEDFVVYIPVPRD